LELDVCRKWRNPGGDKLPTLIHFIRCQLSSTPKRVEIERGEHINDDDLVRRIHIELLVERERDRVIVERRIRARPVLLNGSMREPCEELGNIPRTQGARSRRTGTVPVVEVKVEGVLKALPLCLSEQAAKGRVAEGDGLFVRQCPKRKEK